MKPVRVGDIVPDFSLKDQDGNIFNISHYRGSKKLVIFFYSPDGYYDCQNSTCYFRNFSDSFDEPDVMLLGICCQDETQIKEFVKRFSIPYPVLSDPANEVRRRFGLNEAVSRNHHGRVTYVTDLNGIVLDRFESRLRSECHADEAIKISMVLKRIKGMADLQNS